MRQIVRDARDQAFVQLLIQVLILIPASAACLFFLEIRSPHLNSALFGLLAVFHSVIVLYFFAPFTLMLHNISHKNPFSPGYQWIAEFVQVGVAPLLGQTPLTYFCHHIGMHHPEENLPVDRSSTMRFQRDSILHFLIYWGRFLFLGVFDLLSYLKSKKRTKLYRQALWGELSYWVCMAGFAYLAPWATFVVFIIPFLISRTGMMLGNWAQHAFIDPKDPQSGYGNSITCIETLYNKRCFNDGYHIGHHNRPTLHWSEMPGEFEKNRDLYVSRNAIVFRGVDYFGVWFFLMTKNYVALATRLVLQAGTSTLDERVRLLRSRTLAFNKGR